MRGDSTDHWVFGYGSLMWRPGFAYEEAQHARLVGFRRCFCIYSVHHRGTPERPGMVLGLDRGGACEGIAYRIAGTDFPAVARYLRGRELINGVYREAIVPVQLTTGQRNEVLALAFIVEQRHPSYAGRLPLAVQARLIRAGCGKSGANLDYLINTLRHLAAIDIRERDLERLLTLIGPHTARGACGAQESPFAKGIMKDARALRPPVRGMRAEQRRRFNYRLRLAGRVPWSR
jgi:glutathione-specific gamma-glutamylcyclotransferase